MKKYMDKFEVMADSWSKELFKKLQLHHWSPTSKMLMTLLIVIGPSCFILVASIALCFIKIYNKFTLTMYERKMQGLRAKEKSILD